MSAINSSIFGTSDCTLAVSPFSRLLGCISLPVFVGVGFNGGGGMLYKIHSNPKHCLYGELPPACQRVRHTRAAAVAHPYEREVPKCRTSQFGRCFLPAHVRMWNDLPSFVFDSGTLSGFKGAVNLSLLH